MSKKFFLAIFILIFTVSCNAIKPKKVDTRKVPISGAERARKNVEQGGGVSLKGILRRDGTNFEFSSSNPLWRASLEILDFMPMTTVDYSGGIIISDWYTGETNDNSSIKISVRFLSNEVRADSVKVIVHKKKCRQDNNCQITLVNNSKISQELKVAIIKKAALFEKQVKEKK
tara:strand:+ start:217 stop:735 length:519 start_codon:yes stop_codon:yes gene_type:complete